MNQLMLCMDSEKGRVLAQNWLCLTMTEQTSFLCIILHMLKSADQLPLFILLLVAMVAVCVECYQEKQLSNSHRWAREFKAKELR